MGHDETGKRSRIVASGDGGVDRVGPFATHIRAERHQSIHGRVDLFDPCQMSVEKCVCAGLSRSQQLELGYGGEVTQLLGFGHRAEH